MSVSVSVRVCMLIKYFAAFIAPLSRSVLRIMIVYSCACLLLGQEEYLCYISTGQVTTILERWQTKVQYMLVHQLWQVKCGLFTLLEQRADIENLMYVCWRVHSGR